LAVLKRRATVEAEAWNAKDGELHRQDIARLAARVIGRRLVDGGHFTVRKCGGVELRRVKRVLVEPEADRVFRFHLSGSPRAILAPLEAGSNSAWLRKRLQTLAIAVKAETLKGFAVSSLQNNAQFPCNSNNTKSF